MRFPDVTVARSIPPNPTGESIPAELDARLAVIETRASRAGAAFVADTAASRSLALAARGASVESDRWAAAQLQLAQLGAHHDAASLALADLDILAASARMAQATPEDLEVISAMQLEIGAQVDEQAQILGQINAQLGNTNR